MKSKILNSNGKFLLLVLVGMLMSVQVFAQSITVNGVVKDKTGESIIGANVLVKGTTNGTITDFDGNFTLQANKGDILVISFIGYQSQELPASAQMNVVLSDDTQILEDVVVIGYGTVKKSDATGSVTAIKPDEFNKGLRTTAQDALVGKMSGVNVVSGSGAPGSSATIRIRSGASLSASNDPLIVIDGVPVDNSTIEGGGNVIGAINPNDIETFTILKDASATAIYGSRASNGVIVITTKKGTSNKPQVNYSMNLAVSTPSDMLEVLSADEFREYVPTVTGVPANAVYGTSNTDWQDEIYRNSFSQEHNISVSGKTKNIPYRASIGYTNQAGIIKNNDYQRLTFNGGISPKFFEDHLSVDLNLKMSYESNDKVDDSVVGNALRYDPTRPVKTGSATASTDPGLGYYIWMNGESPMAIQTDNPVAQLELQKNNTAILRSIGNANINYKVHNFEDLKFTLNMGYDILSSKENKDVPELAGMMYTSNMKDGTGLVYDGKQEKKNTLLDFYGTYNPDLGEKHSFDVMAGYGWQHFWRKFNSTTRSPEGDDLFSPTHYETEYYLLSLYGRLNYSYNNRYMVTATLRADASSRFAKNNRWGYFPSVALGWKISEEGFMKDQDVMNNLKLRLSYGQTGQQDILNDYPYMTTFTVSYPESSYQFGDKWYNTYRPNGYDPDIKWETTTTYNVGIDYGFLNNRINGSIDYYQRYTKDLLNTINVIAGTNYAPVLTTNIGSMENKGAEFSINFIPVTTKDWECSISSTGKTVQVFMVDERPYTFYLAKQAYDENGKPLEGQYIQPDGSVSSTETRYATGKSSLPTSYLGLNTQLSYKNWDFAISGHGSLGNYMYNYVAADQYVQSVYSDQGSFSNILKATRDTGFQQQQLYSDYFLEDASFFRIDNISLGYTFRKLWNDSSSLRLTAGVQNVVTFTKYSGLDPEIYSGIDKEVYPRPRTFSFSASLIF